MEGRFLGFGMLLCFFQQKITGVTTCLFSKTRCLFLCSLKQTKKTRPNHIHVPFWTHSLTHSHTQKNRHAAIVNSGVLESRQSLLVDQRRGACGTIVLVQWLLLRDSMVSGKVRVILQSARKISVKFSMQSAPPNAR